VLEYNVRFGDPEAQVVLPLLETDLVEIAEAIIAGKLKEVDINWLEKVAVCVVMASGGYPIDYETGKEITGVKEAAGLDKIIFQAGTKKQDGKLLTDGGRVLGITALGKDYEGTINGAYQGVEEINFAEAHYRTDIGHNVLENNNL
jgi:phosphoribosylamine--glycine ligase